MNKFLEVIKANKGQIIKKALIIGGTIVGLALVLPLIRNGEDAGENGETCEAEMIDEGSEDSAN